MNCLLFDKSDIKSENLLSVTGNKLSHINNILKLGIGDKIKIGIINEKLGVGKIIKINQYEAIISFVLNKKTKSPNINVILAMPRPKVMNRLWEQLASLGVNTIFIIGANKVEKYYFNSHTLKKEHYTPLLIKGLEQACCVNKPNIYIEPNIQNFFNQNIFLNSMHLNFIADVKSNYLISEFKNKINKADSITVAIGPEGGWIDNEINLFIKNDFIPICLGERILRVDTATISIISIIRSLNI